MVLGWSLDIHGIFTTHVYADMLGVWHVYADMLGVWFHWEGKGGHGNLTNQQVIECYSYQDKHASLLTCSPPVLCPLFSSHVPIGSDDDKVFGDSTKGGVLKLNSLQKEAKKNFVIRKGCYIR